MFRSMLFVPGDDQRKQTKALSSPADALIIDLEDAVEPARLPLARSLARELLKDRERPRDPALWVRVNPLHSQALKADLDAVLDAVPDGLVVPKVDEPEDLMELDHALGDLERRNGLQPNTVKLMPIITETARGVLNLWRYGEVSLARLAAVTWGAEDLATELGTSTNRCAEGYTPIFQTVRTLCALAAAAADVPAIDTVHPDFRNLDALAAEARLARRDGFRGKLAIHPGQLEVINSAFTATPAEIEHATRIIEAFAAAPIKGAVSVDGRMLDRPHLMQARRVLADAQKAQAVRR